MSFPEPEAGLVISYSYLWHYEHEQKQEEGRKDRPCVIVLVVETSEQGTEVVVLPVTHLEPTDAAMGIEIPPKVKKHLGLDADRSWVIVAEGNRFLWPGFDLRKVPGSSDQYDYGLLPPKFFEQIVATFAEWHRKVTTEKAAHKLTAR
jgi:mRNA-degrading endonuclease toxin of MazEF toxin-antitoxin module